jgi:hypothetical protein
MEIGAPHLRSTGKIDYDFAAVSISLTSISFLARSRMGKLYSLTRVSVESLPAYTHLYLHWFGALDRMFE